MSFAELKAALVKAERLEGVREEIRIDRFSTSFSPKRPSPADA